MHSTHSRSFHSFDLQPPKCQHQLTNNHDAERILLNAVRKYTFVGSPLWRMSDGKDLVRVELTFHKVLSTNKYKKSTESRRLPAPSAGEWPRQPDPAPRPTRRQTPVRQPLPCQEKETSPPPAQTLPDTPRQHIILQEISNVKMMNSDVVIVKVQCL